MAEPFVVPGPFDLEQWLDALRGEARAMERHIIPALEEKARANCDAITARIAAEFARVVGERDAAVARAVTADRMRMEDGADQLGDAVMWVKERQRLQERERALREALEEIRELTVPELQASPTDIYLNGIEGVYSRVLPAQEVADANS